MGTNKEQGDLELFPIYEKDLIPEADDLLTFPIFEADILTGTNEDEQESAEISARVDQLEGDLFVAQKQQTNEVETKTELAIDKDDAVTIVPNGLSILTALKLTGKYPTKKDDQKNVVPDMFAIDKVVKVVPKGENVLFACYTFVAYCSMAKVKLTKKAIMKLPLSDNVLRVFVITDSLLVLSSIMTSEKDAIVIPRRDIIKVDHVFEKKLGSVGQTQIFLNNGNIIVITIYKEIGGEPDQKQFDDFKKKIDGLLEQQKNITSERETQDEADQDGEDEFEQGVLTRKSSAETFKRILLDPEQYQNPYISTIDRRVAVVLIKTLIPLFDQYVASDKKNSTLLLIHESCIYKKLNELLHDERIGYIDINDFNAAGKVSREAFEAIKSITKDYADELDELIKDVRTHYMKELKNS